MVACHLICIEPGVFLKQPINNNSTTFSIETKHVNIGTQSKLYSLYKVAIFSFHISKIANLNLFISFNLDSELIGRV